MTSRETARIPDDLEDLIPHMRPVQAAERDLRDLGLIWQMTESSAAIGCPAQVAPMLATLIETRRRFDRLQRRLVGQMALENRAEVGDSLAAMAQCAIDILVRNLYERTADVGFLSTDDMVRAFCAAAPAQRESDLPAMRRRLAEYQAKYSVYDDVILISPQGRILARLDPSASLDSTRSAVVAEALACSAYVESFGLTDLAEGSQPALLYAHRIIERGQAVGVLVLRFRFADELQRIFDGIVDDSQRIVLTLVDDARHVIASSDEAHIARGTRLPALPEGRAALTSFAGREYMGIACASSGYQGYRGPRWQARAMVSLLTAFRQRGDTGGAAVPLENAELSAISQEAESIDRELRRVLWNGGLAIDGHGADSDRLTAVLRQVGLTSTRTRTRLREATHEIFRIALSRSRRQAGELARLAADVMDRNLYERANDCRWWALSPVLQRELAAPRSTAGDKAMQAVLAHINGLYTVYSQLVAFDGRGIIRAVSADKPGTPWAGQAVPAHWLSLLSGLSSSQHYAVTPFEPTALHEHGATYVYLAAVRAEGDRRLLGGVAIVFHAARELQAILGDILGRRNGFAAFVDASGTVLAATDAALACGPAISFDGTQAIVEHAGAHYACARVQAPGYREFKIGDGYRNGVCAVVGLRLGTSERRQASYCDFELSSSVAPAHAPHLEAAVFQVGAARYALPARSLSRAMPIQDLMRTPDFGGTTVGLVDIGAGSGSSTLVRVVCARRLFGVDHPARSSDGVILVLGRADGSSAPPIALRVDDVLTVMRVAERSVHPAPAHLGRFGHWVAAMIDCESTGPDGSQPVLVQWLSSERLIADLAGAGRGAVAVPAG